MAYSDIAKSIHLNQNKNIIIHSYVHLIWILSTDN